MCKHQTQKNHQKQVSAQPDEPTRRRLGTIWYLIGLAWQCGDGLDENERLAIDSFRRAADYGNTEAMHCLADYCRDRDLMKAMDWWLLAWKTAPSSDEQDGGDSETVRRYREAAARGCAGAQARLGECLFRGYRTKRNRKEAIKWFRLAAARGNARAMLHLGGCYLFGDCVKKNETKAFRLWMRSAKGGYAEAQYYIGLCYEYGDHDQGEGSDHHAWCGRHGQCDIQRAGLRHVLCVRTGRQRQSGHGQRRPPSL